MSEAPKPLLTDDEIDRIIKALRKQVEWNGWEEPYVRDCFRKELDALSRPSPL